MNETGGDLEDYVKLNQDYSKYDDMSMLREYYCLLYTSPSPRDRLLSRMPSSA